MRGFVPVKTTMRKNYTTDDNIRNYPDLILPSRADNGSAGYDLHSPIEIVVYPQERLTLWTDFKAYMLADEYLSLHIRSSLAVKHKLSLINTVGIVDSSYANNQDNDGNIALCIVNNSDEPYKIREGDRVAQGIFQKYLTTCNDVVINKKRIGGFGSSGK